MFSALLSFLGGSAFRMVFNEVASWYNRRQEHAHELEALRLQATLDGERHARDLERLRLQAGLGVREVAIQADADVARLEAAAFVEALKGAHVPSGVRWIDGWNGAIRPLCATIAVALWVGALATAGFRMSEWDRELLGVILGFFFASRALISGKK